jgi:hypothetical protein
VTYKSHSIGTTEEQLFLRDPHCTSWIIYNIHATNDIYIDDGKGGVEDNGMLIKAGGSHSEKVPEDDPTSPIWIVASGASTTIRVKKSYGYLDERWFKPK